MDCLNKKFGKAGFYLAYPMAYLYVWFFMWGFDGAGRILDTVLKTSFTLLFILWNELVLKGRGKGGKLSKADIFWYGSLVATALLSSVSPSVALAMFVLHLVVVYSVIVRSRGLLKGDTSEFIFADFFNAFVIKSFGNIGALFTAPIEFSDKNKKAGNIIVGILAIIILIPVFIVAICILGSLDESFGNLFNVFVKYLSIENVFEIIAKLFVSVPVCLYLFGLLTGYSKETEEKTRKQGDELASSFEKLRAAPMVISRILIIVFALLYLVFFGFRAKYFFSAFAGKTAEGFLLSEYARKGFFELCGIMAINLFVFAVIRFLSLKEEYDSKFNKILITILMGESILFAISSLSKLILYYANYGFTSKRAMALWGTVFLAAGAVLVIVSLFKKKRNYMSIWVYIVMSTYILMCLVSAINFFAGGYQNKTQINLNLKNEATRIEVLYYDSDNYRIERDVIEYENSLIGVDDTVYSKKPENYDYYVISAYYPDGKFEKSPHIYEQYNDTIITYSGNGFLIQ